MTPPPPTSTDDLLAQAGWVRALARRLARDAASADDLAQSALGAALARPPEQGRPLRPWLARVLSNLARKEQRGTARRLQRERVAARPEAGHATDDLLAELEEQQRLAQLTADLPEPYRTVVLRRYYRGESAAAIARALGVSAATVRSQLARGLTRLREQIERRCDGDRQRTMGVLALAAGGREGLLGGSLLSTTTLIAMNTATKLATLTAAAAAVCVGTLILMSERNAEAVHPEQGAVAAAPSAPALATPERDEMAPSATEAARVAVLDAEPEAAPAAEADVEEVALAPHVVYLRAVDEAGRPIAGARLRPTTEDGLPRDFPSSPPSGSDGRVELELDRKACFQYVGRENANAFLCLQAPGHAMTFFVGIVTLNGRHDQGDRVLAPGGSVSGLVLDPSGVPVEGATVIATSALVDGAPAAARLSGPDVEGGRPTVLTDPSGLFDVDGAHVGPTRVWARAKGFQWSFSDTVDVRSGAVVLDVELTLELLPEDARIAGTVVDPAGLPVEGAEVTYRTPSYDEEQLLTDAAGRFAIDLEARRVHVLTTYDPQGRHGPAQPLSASFGDTDVVIALTPRRMISVRAESPAGQPLEGVGVLAVIVDDDNDYMNQSWSHTDAAGRVELPARGAPFRVSFSEPGYESLKLGPFDPEALPEGEIVARLVLEPSISGIVLHGEQPVEGARIELVQTFPGDSRELTKGFPSRYWSSGRIGDVRSDAEGRFKIAFRGNDRMESVLLVEKEGLALAEHALPNLSTEEGHEQVEVRLMPGGTLEGYVRVPSNRSQEGVVIGVSRGDGRPRFTRTDVAGRYRLEHLTPGPWRVEDRANEPEGRVMSIRSAEEAPFDWNCEVREGQVTVFVVDLRWQEDLRVHGRLTLDGTGASGWSAVIEAPASADREFQMRPAVLDEEGRFAAEALPGDAQLVLRSTADELPVRILVAKIRVTEDLQPIELALETGALAGRIEGGAAHLRIHHRIDPSTHIEAVFDTDAEGAFELSGVPVGELSLQREEKGSHGLGWYPYRSVEILAGETATVD